MAAGALSVWMTCFIRYELLSQFTLQMDGGAGLRGPPILL